MTQTDGNVQTMSVHDKDHASLPPTEEGQDVASLTPIVVPPPSYTDPNNPNAAAGSINMDLDEHPLELSEDYGGSVGEYRQVVNSPLDVGLGNGHPDNSGEAAKTQQASEVELPEKREDWQKKHYQAALKVAGLGISGNLAELEKRYKEFEAEEQEYADYKAGDWIEDVDAAETQDDLDNLKAAYARSGHDYSTVVTAFEEKQAELSGPTES